MKVFISGPMTNIYNYNFKSFDRAKMVLESHGYEVISPADIDREHGWVQEINGRVKTTRFFDLEEAITVCCDNVKQCDAIALLPGWQQSYGSKRELRTALDAGLSVILFNQDFALIS